jgi:hypothetical protein
MKKQNARLYRQFHLLADKVKTLVEQHKWENLSASVQQRIIRKLKWRYSRLRGAFSTTLLLRALGAAALVLGISATSQAQSFKAPVVNPYSLDSLADLNAPAMVDIDDDGDLDLFAGDYYGNFLYFENTGTATTPNFAAPDSAAFGLSNMSYFHVPRFADIDDDGDMDLFLGTYVDGEGIIVYHENTGSSTAASFAAGVNNPFGITKTQDYAFPAIADMDGDGDLDLLVGEEYGNRIYFENTGTASSPAFGAAVTNPFGMVVNPMGYTNPIALADLDGDGDVDLFEVDYANGDILYYENTGTSSAAAFAAPVTNPFSLVPAGAEDLSFAEFGDLDSDGDLDLMVGDYYGAFIYYENESGPSGIGEHSLDANVLVYPSVTDGKVTIQLNNANAVMLTVSNQLGQVVKQENVSGRNVLDLHLNEAPGLYLFTIQDADGQQVSRKVVLQ